MTPTKKTAKASAKKTTAKKTAAKSTAPKKKSTTKSAESGAAAPKTVNAAASPKPSSKAPSELLQGFGNFEPYQGVEGEAYMNEQQVAHFRNILLAWKHALMEEVDRTVTYMKDEAANFPDPNDRASQESDFTMELRTRDRERKLIKKIEESLEMLENGDYGYCDSCGIEIGVRRLEARPTANLCIDCKTLDEIKERQMG